jgi:hypothetical protein
VTGFGVSRHHLDDADVIAGAVDATRWEAKWALVRLDPGESVTARWETSRGEVMTYGYIDDDGEVRLSTVVVEYRPARKRRWFR